MKAALGKIGKIDFFAVLPSGTYILLSFYIFVIAGTDSQMQGGASLWAAFIPLVDLTHSKPTTLLLMLFSSYLLGSVLRALPVSFSEKAVNMFFSDKEPFPYQSELDNFFSELKRNSRIAGIDGHTVPDGGNAITKRVFNYWKHVICLHAPEAFVNYQEFEARTRFFSGMFLAGAIGAFVSLLCLVKALSYAPAWYLLVLSVLVALSYGLSVRRVRVQEATTLAGLYLAYLQHTKVNRHATPLDEEVTRAG
ncbi:MAG TPA: hypothetical protein ENJ19_11080 [Gammaproteobacteria bacterium]|nr:hypothetical protein [Gammaproteobacteria bacterium]